MKYLALLIIFLILAVTPVKAASPIDSDNDGLPDNFEINTFKTDPHNPDTDGDGYDDGQEIRSGYSPLGAGRLKAKDNDYDHDGLTNDLEIKFHTDPFNSDTDSDGYSDGQEIKNGYDPLRGGGARLEKKIEINLEKQSLSYFLGQVKLGSFLISSGTKAMPTPKGNYKIDGKSLKAWSKYGLWMPYWMSLYNGKFGIHELPIWPNGKREGENHLGKPVSHGCVRLGRGPAKLLYDWAELGTPVRIY